MGSKGGDKCRLIDWRKTIKVEETQEGNHHGGMPL